MSAYRCFVRSGYQSSQKIGTRHVYYGHRVNPKRRYVDVTNCGNNHTEKLLPVHYICVRYGYPTDEDNTERALLTANTEAEFDAAYRARLDGRRLTSVRGPGG